MHIVFFLLSVYLKSETYLYSTYYMYMLRMYNHTVI